MVSPTSIRVLRYTLHCVRGHMMKFDTQDPAWLPTRCPACNRPTWPIDDPEVIIIEGDAPASRHEI